MSKQEKPLYTLIPLEEFKAVLGVDDREDKLAGYCLVTSTYTIEQHCKRRFLKNVILNGYTSHFGFVPERIWPGPEANERWTVLAGDSINS